MALPIDGRQFNNVLATTFDAKLPRLIDAFFRSNPLFVRLHSRDAIKHDGGASIRTPLIYTDLGGGSYGKGDTFDTSFREFMTDLLLNWKRNYAPIVLDNLETAMNSGVARVIDLVDAVMETAKMTLANNCGTQSFGDGTGNGAKDMDGLAIAVASTGTYGGIVRDGSLQGNAVTAQVNSVGGAFSLSMVNTSMGTATVGAEKPDLIITTQTIWNKFWDRIQPAQRFGSEDMKKAGMESIQFNGCDVVVDSHCPDGFIYLLNTKYVEFWIMTGNDFKIRGPFDVYNQDSFIGQCILYSNLVVPNPRMQARISNVT